MHKPFEVTFQGKEIGSSFPALQVYTILILATGRGDAIQKLRAMFDPIHDAKITEVYQ